MDGAVSWKVGGSGTGGRGIVALNDLPTGPPPPKKCSGVAFLRPFLWFHDIFIHSHFSPQDEQLVDHL